MGWNIISKLTLRRNRREAYNALKPHFEGGSYFDLMRYKANTKIAKTLYQDDKHIT